MNILFVVSDADDWPISVPGIRVLPALVYLTHSDFAECHDTRVFNLCRNIRYQSDGYYVSLLAQARGHAPLPSVEALKDLQSEDLLSRLDSELADLTARSLNEQSGDHVELEVYFGRSPNAQHRHLCRLLFERLNLPLLHAVFTRTGDRWRLAHVSARQAAQIPPPLRGFAAQAATEHLQSQRLCRSRPEHVPRLAILHDPLRSAHPSNSDALHKFIDAAARLGMQADLVTPADVGRVPGQYDALFIRDTTNVNHYTYQLARNATAEGLIVIDDPDSILRCTNKVYLHELLARHHIPTPRTVVVHRGNLEHVVSALGLPCVLKQPDGAFSQGVMKVTSPQQFDEQVQRMLETSELVLAQEFLPTRFDWRVGVLDGRPLFVCKYFMAPGHWQVIKHGRHSVSEGRTEALSVGEAPDEVVRTALRAAAAIGDGFYGVDLKQVGAQVLVIEVNDNPNVDAGNEDAILGDALYREVMGVFRKRIDAMKGARAP